MSLPAFAFPPPFGAAIADALTRLRTASAETMVVAKRMEPPRERSRSGGIIGATPVGVKAERTHTRPRRAWDAALALRDTWGRTRLQPSRRRRFKPSWRGAIA